MVFYNGIKGKRNYFEGWFFRICSEGFNCAIIPSISVVDGLKTAYIQVNCNDFYKVLEYDFDSFTADDTEVRIGNNTFTASKIKFSCDGLVVDAEFGVLLPLRSDIMGPFKFGTPCKHKIIGMRHSVSGAVTHRDKSFSLDNAVGYIEKDFGKSFPTAYCWLQCNDFDRSDASFFCSVAKLNLPFRGLICVLIVGGEEYRFATYNFAKILKLERYNIVLKKSDYILNINFSQGANNNPLLAPNKGKMSYMIKEDLNGKISLELYKADKLLYSLNGKNAGIEWEFN